ncbi:MAG: anthranilate phosphoribosyltransferase [Firmicutes bacterium]|nr:anthranilate phosphoribosyltransferase [Bacillota bacterium]
MSDIILQALQQISVNQSLDEQTSFEVMDAIMQGHATDAQIGAVLMGLRVRGETVEEITGFARAMREHATPITVLRRPLVDTCGTGGDRSFTFNVSTVSAFVVAGAGVGVAKHGNRSATSKSGSADLLEALGISLTVTPAQVAHSIEEYGFGFLFAQNVHAAMKYAAGPRKQLGVRTIFNILGPLTNPAAPEYQLLGVYSPDLVEPVAQVLARLGLKRALVVHGDGMDEVALSGPTVYGLVEEGTVHLGTVTPEDLGLPAAPREAVRGGDPQTNAEICRRILAGESGPTTDMVAANAGLALFVAGAAPSMKEGVRLAQETLRSGAAARIVEALKQDALQRG